MGQNQSYQGFKSQRNGFIFGKGRRRKTRLNSSRMKINDDGFFEVTGDDALEVIARLDDQLEYHKNQIEEIRIQGQMVKNRQQYELGEVEKELYQKKLDLHRLGERAKSYVSFWDYVRIINKAKVRQKENIVRKNEESSSHKSPRYSVLEGLNYQPSKRESFTTDDDERPSTQKSSTTADDEKPSKSKSAIVNLRHALSSFTIFTFFEAYLLKRLHLAVLLKNQRGMQKDGWNKVILHIYGEIPKIKNKLANEKSNLITLKFKNKTFKADVSKLTEHIIYLHSTMIARMQHIAAEFEPEEEQERPMEAQASLNKRRSTYVEGSKSPIWMRKSIEKFSPARSKQSVLDDVEESMLTNSADRYEGESAFSNTMINENDDSRRSDFNSESTDGDQHLFSIRDITIPDGDGEPVTPKEKSYKKMGDKITKGHGALSPKSFVECGVDDFVKHHKMRFSNLEKEGGEKKQEIDSRLDLDAMKTQAQKLKTEMGHFNGGSTQMTEDDTDTDSDGKPKITLSY